MRKKLCVGLGRLNAFKKVRAYLVVLAAALFACVFTACRESDRNPYSLEPRNTEEQRRAVDRKVGVDDSQPSPEKTNQGQQEAGYQARQREADNATRAYQNCMEAHNADCSHEDARQQEARDELREFCADHPDQEGCSPPADPPPCPSQGLCNQRPTPDVSTEPTPQPLPQGGGHGGSPRVSAIYDDQMRAQLKRPKPVSATQPKDQNGAARPSPVQTAASQATPSPEISHVVCILSNLGLTADDFGILFEDFSSAAIPAPPGYVAAWELSLRWRVAPHESFHTIRVGAISDGKFNVEFVKGTYAFQKTYLVTYYPGEPMRHQELLDRLMSSADSPDWNMVAPYSQYSTMRECVPQLQ